MSLTYAPVFMFQQASMEAIPAMQHIVYHSPAVGYWVVSDIVSALLTPEQRREWERSESETIGFDEVFPNEPVPAFSSIEDTIAWASTMDAIASIRDDLVAFNAPEECGLTIYRDLEAKLGETLQKSIGLVPFDVLNTQCN